MVKRICDILEQLSNYNLLTNNSPIFFPASRLTASLSVPHVLRGFLQFAMTIAYSVLLYRIFGRRWQSVCGVKAQKNYSHLCVFCKRKALYNFIHMNC
jgi:hypothetical protein